MAGFDALRTLAQADEVEPGAGEAIIPRTPVTPSDLLSELQRFISPGILSAPRTAGTANIKKERADKARMLEVGGLLCRHARYFQRHRH